MRGLSYIALLCALASPVGAQDFGLTEPAQIETQELDAAQDFDPGILPIEAGALDTALWQGTSAVRAAKLLDQAPVQSTDPLVRDMLRAVVLSGGVPPRADSEADTQAYARARLRAVLALGGAQTVDGFLARNPDLAKAPLAQVDLALGKGDAERACTLSDTVTTGRAETPWVRLRAACHALRGERAAAELTRDLLRNQGYEDAAYFAQLDAVIAGRAPVSTTSSDPLTQFLATRKGAPTELAAGRDADLAALLADFDTLDLAGIQSALGNLSFDVALGDLDRETAMASPSARATARLFVLGQSGDAGALDAFINRAVRAGVSETTILQKLAPMIQTLPATARAEANLGRYARAAVVTRDIGGLQSLYGALPDGPLRARIALAADAIGGGFTAQGLGRDIDSRLSDPARRTQAIEDAVIALALGATVSDTASDVLAKATLPRPTLGEGELLLLDLAARSDARAETSLRAAQLLSRQGLNLSDRAAIIRALHRAGLSQFSGPLAASAFLDASPLTQARSQPISSP
jgi:hypothetical protein